MATLTVEVKDGTGVFQQVQADEAILNRSMGRSTAQFRVPDASVSDRKDLIVSTREVRISIDVDGQTIRFAGYVSRPAVEAMAPGHFSLRVKCVGLELGASKVRLVSEVFPAGTKYVTVIDSLWANWWPAVVRDIMDDPRTIPAGAELQWKFSDLARATNDVINDYLGNMVWWMEWDGTDYVLRVRRPEDEVAVDTITENDVAFGFEMEPSVADVRNQVTVIGGVGGGDADPLKPVYAVASDADSVTRFGTHDRHIVDTNVETNEACAERAAAEVKKAAWPAWRVSLGFRKFGVQPGNRVLLNLPTIGLDGVNFAMGYLVESIRDEYSRGTVRRVGDFREALPLEKIPP